MLISLVRCIFINEDKVAEYLFEALVSFQRKTTNISEVHGVIYEKDKFSQFQTAMQKCIQTQSNQSQGLFSNFKGMFEYGNVKSLLSSSELGNVLIWLFQISIT